MGATTMEKKMKKMFLLTAAMVVAAALSACAPGVAIPGSAGGGGQAFVNGCAAPGGADADCVVRPDLSRGEVIVDQGGTTAGGHPRPPIIDTPDPTPTPPPVSSSTPAPDETVTNETTAGGHPTPPPVSE